MTLLITVYLLIGMVMFYHVEHDLLDFLYLILFWPFIVMFIGLVYLLSDGKDL